MAAVITREPVTITHTKIHITCDVCKRPIEEWNTSGVSNSATVRCYYSNDYTHGAKIRIYDLCSTCFGKEIIGYFRSKGIEGRIEESGLVTEQDFLLLTQGFEVTPKTV